MKKVIGFSNGVCIILNDDGKYSVERRNGEDVREFQFASNMTYDEAIECCRIISLTSAGIPAEQETTIAIHKFRKGIATVIYYQGHRYVLDHKG